jgi:hypothetical protein
MDNYKIEEITVTYSFWSDAYSSYIVSSNPGYSARARGRAHTHTQKSTQKLTIEQHSTNN